MRLAAARHSPERSVISTHGAPSDMRWGSEPAVFAYRKLTAIHRVTGEETSVPINASQAIIRGIGVISASDDGMVRFWDSALRKVYWERKLNDRVYASLTVDHLRERILVATTSGLVCSLTLRGEVAWARHVDLAVFATPVVDQVSDALHVATFESTCTGLDLATGNVRYRTALTTPWHHPDGLTSHRDIYASPVVTASSKTIVCAGEHVVAVSPDGNVDWDVDLAVTVRASPLLVRGSSSVIVCSVDGRCWMLNTRDGEVTRQVRLDGKILASPIASCGVVAVGVLGSCTYGLDEDTLAVRWSARRSPRSHTSFTVLPNGDFAFLDASGDAVALHALDGGFRWQTSQALGYPSHNPAMDVTPVIADDGWMYCASYEGDLYAFRFRKQESVS